MRTSILPSLLLVGFCALAAHAEQFVYKWTDSVGKVQYSELPPPAGTAYETVRKTGGAVGDTGASQAPTPEREQEALARKLAEDEAAQKAQQEKAQQDAEVARAKNCEIARRNVDVCLLYTSDAADE